MQLLDLDNMQRYEVGDSIKLNMLMAVISGKVEEIRPACAYHSKGAVAIDAGDVHPLVVPLDETRLRIQTIIPPDTALGSHDCQSCAASIINGMLCHEHGCPEK